MKKQLENVIESISDWWNHQSRKHTSFLGLILLIVTIAVSLYILREVMWIFGFMILFLIIGNLDEIPVASQMMLERIRIKAEESKQRQVQLEQNLKELLCDPSLDLFYKTFSINAAPTSASIKITESGFGPAKEFHYHFYANAGADLEHMRSVFNQELLSLQSKYPILLLEGSVFFIKRIRERSTVYSAKCMQADIILISNPPQLNVSMEDLTSDFNDFDFDDFDEEDLLDED